jgi:hypothetical protein
MRDAALERSRQLDREMTRAVQLAIETGELAPETDASQFAFTMLGIILVYHRAETAIGPEEASRRARFALEHLVAQHAAQRAAPTPT